MPDLHLTTATRRDLPTMAALLATAFEHDATLERLVPGERDRVARLTRMLSIEVGALLADGGVADLARDRARGPLLGVAAWRPPAAPRSVAGSLRRRVRGAAAAVRIAALMQPWQVPAASRAVAEFSRLTPAEPHWFLADLAVAPDAHGRGVGGALVARGLARADSSGAPAYLEATSPASRRLYARHGFEDVHALGWDDTGAPFTMWRPARRPGKPGEPGGQHAARK